MAKFRIQDLQNQAREPGDAPMAPSGGWLDCMQPRAAVETLRRLFSIPNRWRNLLYIHTPFCYRKCGYCIFQSKVPRNRTEIRSFYDEVLPRYVDAYRDTLETVRFDEIYFGGGTPTIADPEVMERMFQGLPGFDAIPLKMIEFHPHSLTREHIDLWRKYCFQYVSFGVQTLSREILEQHGRFIVDGARLERICRWLDEAEIISNADLIFFLQSGSVRDLAQSRADLTYAMSELRPVAITVHSNHKHSDSYEKRAVMIEMVNDVLSLHPEYRCVNSELRPSDIETDIWPKGEYRLMRKDHRFHMFFTPKVGSNYRYGYNTLALGQYEDVKPTSNFYYAVYKGEGTNFDLRESDFNAGFHRIEEDFGRARRALGLPHPTFVEFDDFFTDAEGRDRFRAEVSLP